MPSSAPRSSRRAVSIGCWAPCTPCPTRAPGRALEINTRLPLHSTIVAWWHQEGGDAVTFGSDAHLPAKVAHGFAEAARMAAAHGFRPGRNRYDPWPRDRHP